MSAKTDEKIVEANHIGLGFKTIEQVEAIKAFLLERGAVIVREKPEEHMYFLQLDPRNGLLVEIFLDAQEGPSIHFDYTVENLDGVRNTHGTGLFDYGIPNMLFVDVGPYVHPLTVQAAFTVRK